MSGYKLVPVEATPNDMESVWMYKGSDGEWKPFMNEQHRLNTIADGGWEVREFFAAPIVQGEPVAWMYSYIDGTEVQTSKERWTGRDWKSYWEETPLYATPQPAEQQSSPDVSALVEALEGLLPFVTSDSVECRGDKCREHWCLSCWDEETVSETVKNIRTAIAKADDALVVHRRGDDG